MPELPEVETIVRQLGAILVGWRVAHVRVSRRDIVHGDPRPLGRVLVGLRVVGVRRRAKRVIVELDAGRSGRSGRSGKSNGSTGKTGADRARVQLIFHLGMSGRLCLHDTSEKCEPHTHVRIGFANEGRELRFRDPRRFGGVWCLTGSANYRGRLLGPLGPEPLTLRVSHFRKILGRNRKIKALLLDQTAIAGIGNIYCDEALFDAGVHPETPAIRLDEKRARVLLTSIKKTLRSAIKHKGSTLTDYRSADGKPGSFQQMHRIYGREGEACVRCHAPIARLTVAGRSSFVCARCQLIG